LPATVRAGRRIEGYDGFGQSGTVREDDFTESGSNRNTPRKNRKRAVFPSGKTKVVTSPRKLEGEYFTMNWGWTGLYSDNLLDRNKRYAVGGDWAENEGNYINKRHMLVVTGLKN